MHTAKELSHSDVPFIYSFFKAIYAKTSDKFKSSQTEQILYATRHAKLTLRPELHTIVLEFDDTKLYYSIKRDLVFIFSLEAELLALGNLEKLFATILRDARLT